MLIPPKSIIKLIRFFYDHINSKKNNIFFFSKSLFNRHLVKNQPLKINYRITSREFNALSFLVTELFPDACDRRNTVIRLKVHSFFHQSRRILNFFTYKKIMIKHNRLKNAVTPKACLVISAWSQRLPITTISHFLLQIYKISIFDKINKHYRDK